MVTHFAEEQAMAKLQFPGGIRLTEQELQGTGRGYKEGYRGRVSLAVVIETQHSAVDWLTNHIGVVDKELGRFILDKTGPAKQSA